MTRILTKRGLIAAVIMAAAALFASVMPASAATGPDGFTILHADAGNIAHHCEVLGTGWDMYDNEVSAIVCVDIDTGGGESGYHATGAIEAYCEGHNSNGTTFDSACPIITIDGFLANGSSGAANASWSCNDNCSNGGRNYLYTETINYTDGSCTTHSVNDVWSTATAGTKIWLFSQTGSWLTYSVGADGANDGTGYTTGHYWICP